MARRAFSILMHEKKMKYQQWIVDQLKDHYGKGIFAMIREPPRQIPRSKKGRWHRGIVTEPLLLAEHRRLEWMEWWGRAASYTMETLDGLKALRARARQEPRQPITAEQVTAALYTFNDKTGQGLDGVGPLFIKHLPGLAIRDLAALLDRCEEQGMWPWQCLANSIVLLGKPDGGERPIGLLPFLVRLYIRIRRPLAKQWTSAWAQHWDYAIASSSALRSALLQRLHIELSNTAGDAWILIFWDLSKFYDTVAFGGLLDAAADRDYPAHMLQLIMMTYLAPRVIKAAECSSTLAIPSNGIVAGCGEANNLSRIVIYRLAEKASRASPLVQLSQYVDDVKQFSRAPTADAAIAAMKPAAQAFIRAVQDDKLVLSGKSVVVASSKQLAYQAVKVAADEGITLKMATTAKDLGVDVFAGQRRTVVLAKRLRLALSRATRAKKLPVQKARVRINIASVGPKAAYGAVASGWTPTAVAKLKTARAMAVGLRPGMSATALLQLENQADPAWELPLQVILSYIKMWLKETHMRSPIALAWPSPALLSWKTVRGPWLQ